MSVRWLLTLEFLFRLILVRIGSSIAANLRVRIHHVASAADIGNERTRESTTKHTIHSPSTHHYSVASIKSLDMRRSSRDTHNEHSHRYCNDEIDTRCRC